ncbi:MAG: osmotically inducible protein C [Hirschia sp.]|nr:osmotically inducible protein C [Hirschia sp.]MBF19314.1 osmotically inducible protein C [Hirschia sp.]|tara:strand:- start:153 stop:1343 length:1191 start_codon:yes stop_codon:yes gene_type:complete
MSKHRKITFPGGDGAQLAARLDLPAMPPRGYALFAHCFTCSKDSLAASRISARLADLGFGVLRFDFTGLGDSDGDFSNTNFSSNIEDLVAAAHWMEAEGMAPSLAIGHSLGGAAVIAAAKQLPMVKAFATLGAPSEPGHLEEQLAGSTCQIEKEGSAEVDLAGRQFLIRKQFLDDIRHDRVQKAASELRRPLLVMHAPLDETVSIDNATQIFLAARHPRSFVSLDEADHLLTRREDADYAASVIAAWAGRYLPNDKGAQESNEVKSGHVNVSESGWSLYQNKVSTRDHVLFADEPTSLGGSNSGPSPFDLVSAALGACTSITLRMYADRKNLPLEHVSVDITREKQENGRVLFNRAVQIEGDIPENTRQRMVEIAEKCPVHRLLNGGADIRTTEST